MFTTFTNMSNWLHKNNLKKAEMSIILSSRHDAMVEYNDNIFTSLIYS